MQLIQCEQIIDERFLTHFPDDGEKIIKTQMAQKFTNEMLKNDLLDFSKGMSERDMDWTIIPCIKYQMKGVAMKYETYLEISKLINTIRASRLTFDVRYHVDRLYHLLAPTTQNKPEGE